MSDDLQILYWSRVPDAAAETAKALAESGGGAAAPAAAPAKKSMFGGSKDGEVKSLSMAMVSAVSAGLKTGMMKKMEERSKGFMGISLTAKSLKPLELNPDCAFSVLSQERTLDFVAANPEERDRWLKNLRLVLVHARTYDGFGGGGAAMALMKQAAQNAQPAGPLSPGMRRAERTKTFAFGECGRRRGRPAARDDADGERLAPPQLSRRERQAAAPRDGRGRVAGPRRRRRAAGRQARRQRDRRARRPPRQQTELFEALARGEGHAGRAAAERARARAELRDVCTLHKFVQLCKALSRSFDFTLWPAVTSRA